jgi:hypothetical protein
MNFSLHIVLYTVLCLWFEALRDEKTIHSMSWEKDKKQQQKNELKFAKDWFEMKKMYKSNGKQRE